MGKKDRSRAGGKSHEEPSVGDEESGGLTGVFTVDLPVLCEQEGLPSISVNIIDSPDQEEGEGEGHATPTSPHPVLLEGVGEDPHVIRSVAIRGWLVDSRVMKVLQEGLQSTQLSSLSLWNTGLAGQSIVLLVQLAEQQKLRSLTLDGNAGTSPDHVAELLSKKCCLESLSLKCCGLSGPSCPSLCRALSDNKTLLSLDLSCNRLCDEGAGHMASALRLNRCLVSLVLVDCGVGDEGARLLAQVLKPFALCHDEVVARRKLLSLRRKGNLEESEVDSAPPRLSAKTLRAEKQDKHTRSSSRKGDAKKEDKNKKEEKGKKGSDSSKSVKPKGKDSKLSKRGPDPPITSPKLEAPEPVNPLLGPVEEKGAGQLFVPGNLSLLNLGLACNSISEEGVSCVLEAVREQGQAQGLIRVTLHCNQVPPSSPLLVELEEALATHNPLLSKQLDT